MPGEGIIDRANRQAQIPKVSVCRISGALGAAASRRVALGVALRPKKKPRATGAQSPMEELVERKPLCQVEPIGGVKSSPALALAL
jgi:hypothetical protein